MTDRGIIFSAPMIRALFADTKTQTRRLATSPLRRANPGDRLWVRECYARVGDNEDDIHACPDLSVHAYYRADNVVPRQLRWRPSIYMPRCASRLTLIVTEVRNELLHDISETDAAAEGMCEPSLRDLGGELRQAAWSERQVYSRLWQHLHGAASWEANPEVIAISFRVVKSNIDRLPAKETRTI